MILVRRQAKGRTQKAEELKVEKLKVKSWSAATVPTLRGEKAGRRQRAERSKVKSEK